ncbi:LamG-like jellyroll fold domain-containing protein [Candidatus Latescibacterota bacterium]
MNNLLSAAVCMLLAGIVSCSNGNQEEARLGTGQIVWNINNLAVIGGHETVITGNPHLIDTPGGKAVEFDGVQDGLQVLSHPLSGTEAFTLEVIFCPYADGPKEQRFFHLQEDGTDNRLLVETRLTDDDQWYLDTFMSSVDGNQTLRDEKYLHPVRQWFNGTLVFDGAEARQYVNGELEFTAEIPAFTPHMDGKTSIGVRMNQVYWFKGAIRKARFTRSALSPEELLKP